MIRGKTVLHSESHPHAPPKSFSGKRGFPAELINNPVALDLAIRCVRSRIVGISETDCPFAIAPVRPGQELNTDYFVRSLDDDPSLELSPLFQIGITENPIKSSPSQCDQIGYLP